MDWPSRNPIIGIAGCCARAASGHAAAPPSKVMNSRRLMQPAPTLENHAKRSLNDSTARHGVGCSLSVDNVHIRTVRQQHSSALHRRPGKGTVALARLATGLRFQSRLRRCTARPFIVPRRSPRVSGRPPMTYATPWHHLAGISVAAFFAVVVTPTQAQEQKFKAVSVKTPDGLTISAQDWGNPNGPEILFIHGFSQSHLSW